MYKAYQTNQRNVDNILKKYILNKNLHLIYIFLKMGNYLCVNNIDDIDKTFITLTPKLGTYIQFCEPCNKEFYINNTNTCYECIFNHKEFCEHDYTISHLSKLNMIMNEMIKDTTLNYCLKSKDVDTRMPFNQINITNIFKVTRKNEKDIEKLNVIIDNLEDIISKYKMKNNLIM